MLLLLKKNILLVSFTFFFCINILLLYKNLDDAVTIDYHSQAIEDKNRKLSTCKVIFTSFYQKFINMEVGGGNEL
ncbi:hypothetical protein [Beggiatoa leptomitoformis]|uniref:Uncharacterized protein n=1 Tax=Beggiatoa leptomitoformis TaxID=288004 RepID=A0A2N9YFZ0_9GAMM|nr:hypothetical protein [Beggiatoa leptomitoformis]ALG68214.1 hypothetical protein AL038_11450 [Beggiatoa leptomitoformis]AUI69481.2 hypothetical protein BLE401_12820 [Beggiatoa leptomitoformis]